MDLYPVGPVPKALRRDPRASGGKPKVSLVARDVLLEDAHRVVGVAPPETAARAWPKQGPAPVLGAGRSGVSRLTWKRRSEKFGPLGLPLQSDLHTIAKRKE